MSSEKDYIKSIDGAERRFAVGGMKAEKRADGDTEAMVVEGYAALYNSPTEMYWYDEEILPGAFDEVLNDDVRCLFNHNPNFILARCVEGKGTLELEADSKGLKYRYTTPDRQYARDLADAIAAGDVSQSSFAFTIKEQVWVSREGQNDLRQIKKIGKLYDVAPVTYPAYADTTVAQRSHDAFLTENAKDIETTEQRSAENKGLSYHEAILLNNENYV